VAGQERDAQVRAAAFSFLDQQVERYGEVVPLQVLKEGFILDGQRVPLVGPQGIFKPAALTDMPLSITTVPQIEGRQRPYEDEVGVDGLLRYRYRGTDPDQRDNAGLRRAMTEGVPLVYFHGIVPGQYLPVYPAYIVGDEPRSLVFAVAVEDPTAAQIADAGSDPAATLRRQYLTRLTRQRLHQAAFRVRVLAAYRTTCAVCRLHHQELLDAAHILADTHPVGQPVVTNGLALCKLHHAAFDTQILGVRPDLVVEIRTDVLHEIDGPMLRYGLQAVHGSTLLIPRRPGDRPNEQFLAERYEEFRRAG